MNIGVYRVGILGLLLMSACANASTLQQIQRVDELLATKDYYPIEQGDLYGKLDKYGSRTKSLELMQGREYLIVGVCDNDCSDIDLSIHNSQGEIVDSDDHINDLAKLKFAAIDDGLYDLEVEMYSCKTAYCYYRVRSYMKSE
ncbi:hypothetical protein [Psychrobacter sp. I-STPA6b]|uniref:hypothetical protein n=1 Tax=Psychrobacter sp. I-STPA6b TaxID=2585718 RepID=UPI001D0C488D|nr:hypothetical protein [Psychrobacter sp. I-STPA6b]